MTLRQFFWELNDLRSNALKLMGNGKARFITYASPSSQENVTSNTVVTTGGWHHVAAVFDGTQKRIYLDGVLDKSQSSTFAPEAAPAIYPSEQPRTGHSRSAG